MNLDLSDFDPAQRLALLDLLVLATYLDQRLAQLEDARVERLLTAMGCATAYDRRRQFDEAVNRVRASAEKIDLVRAHATTLAKRFTTREQCRKVYALLEDLITCDGSVANHERQLLETLHDQFQL